MKGEYDRALQDFDQAIRLDPNTADAFDGRGNAYSSKGQYDRAIQDYDQAIRLDPNYSDAFRDRGAAYYNKGDHDRAIQDYDQAIRLNPSDANAFHDRGGAYYMKDEYDRAIQDYDQAIRLNPRDADAFFYGGIAHFCLAQFPAAQQDFASVNADPYPAIWLYLARARAGQQAQDELARNAAKLDLKVWPGPVINLYLDKATPESVLAAAKDADPKKDLQQRGEACFFLGQRALLSGKPADAQRLFQQTVETRLTDTREYKGAQAELQRLPASPAPPRR